MSFIDMEITRRHFATRYVNVGRAMLANLADMYGVDFDVAENWADAIDREAIPNSATLDPEDSRSGAEPLGAACTAAPSFSHSYPVGSRRGSGAAAIPPAAAAPEQFPKA
ncbi:hypothetical protein [uncultured Sphingobium sp.]|uniref:hypothetical protein n=1 Tax=uncultured Sphingobium sp. TaxID=316087 RepID=UPI00259B83EF|nr:hypothetical protein [uncultured Sphingobium sp.]